MHFRKWACLVDTHAHAQVEDELPGVNVEHLFINSQFARQKFLINEDEVNFSFCSDIDGHLEQWQSGPIFFYIGKR